LVVTMLKKVLAAAPLGIETILGGAPFSGSVRTYVFSGN
jgi:hypothetical protein